MMMVANSRKFHLAAIVLAIFALPTSASACDLINSAAAQKQAVSIAWNYFAVSVVVAASVVGLMIYRRKWSNSVVLLLGVSLVFHPAWTIRPTYGPDCQFLNVEASQVELALMLLLLVAQGFILVRSVGRTFRP